MTCWTAKRQRDLWFTPPDIFPAKSFVNGTSDWWRSIQPPFRNSAARHQHNFYFGERIQPVQLSDWGPILKAGPNGIFLILMALSWIPQFISSLTPTARERAELNAIFEALCCDVEWVLDTICRGQPGEEPKPPSTVRGQKRNAAVGEQSSAANAAKKARKSR